MITQEDRDAAAECIRQGVSHPTPESIIAGERDDWFFVQAFARHRLAGMEQAAVIADGTMPDGSDGTQPEPMKVFRHAVRQIAAAIRAAKDQPYG